MALAANSVAGELQLSGMRIVAIRAGDACREHLALQERGVIIDLVTLLAVRIIKARSEGGGPEGVEEFSDFGRIGCELLAPRMTARADLDLLGGGARRGANRLSRSVDRPGRPCCVRRD